MGNPYTETKVLRDYEPTGHERAVVNSALIMCLVNALAMKGVLSLADFRDELQRTLNEMPHDDAAGAAGFIFEESISRLNSAIPQAKE